MLECRRQAAYCRAELGDIPAALRDFRALLAEISPHRGNRDESE
jgi:hypothetical protein